MSRLVRRTIINVVEEELTGEQELAVLRDLIGDKLTTESWPENHRHRGDVLMIVNPTLRTEFVVGQLVVVQSSGPPDDDGEYNVWYITGDGTLGDSYVRPDEVRLWVAGEKPRKRARKSNPPPNVLNPRRKLRMDG